MRPIQRNTTNMIVGAAVLFTALLPVPAAAQNLPVPPGARVIRVAGMGEVRAQPDEAELLLAVESSAATARAAGQDNARRMDRVIEALVAAGVPRGDIETRNYSVFPEYVHDEGRSEPRIRGYRASNQVSVRTRQLARVGELIDVALNAGANRMNGVSFRVRDAEAVRAQALRQAVERARVSATAIADALGVRLGPVMDASTTGEVVRPVPMMMRAQADMMEAGASTPTPIQPSEQVIHAQVWVTFGIEGR